MSNTSNYATAFVPEIWSKELLRLFDTKCVMRGLVNTDYEGEITAAGDTVHIRNFTALTMRTYSKYTAAITIDNLTPGDSSLTIDQMKYFAFEVDDIDKAQSDIDIIAGYSNRAAVGMVKAIDSYILSLYTEAHTISTSTVGTDASPIDLTSTTVDIYNKIVDLGVALDEHDIPPEGRWLVLPPRVAGYVRKNSLFVHATASGDNMLQTGMLGEIAGFQVYVSNNLVAVTNPTSTAYHNYFPCMAGTKDAITMAMQLAQVEAVRPSLTFTTVIKGLTLFGVKVINPTALAVLKVDSTTI